MNKQKPNVVDYLKIVEINENVFLFRSFLNEDHSEKECEAFYIDMKQRCPELNQKFNFKKGEQIDLSTIKLMYDVYCKFVDWIYENPNIKKNIKPQKNIIKETKAFVKRKSLTLKSVFIKSIILIVSVLLFVLSFYVENGAYNTVLVAIATGLFSSLIFEYLIKIQKEHKDEEKREINQIVTQCINLKYMFPDAIHSYLNNDSDEMYFYDFIKSYERLYNFIQKLKTKTSLNTIALATDVKAFECYYQEKIEQEIKEIDSNYDQLQDFYLKRKEEYKNLLLKPYGLAMEVLDNIIGLYEIDFSFLKEKEKNNGEKDK